jgi:hypothetical protein
MNSETMTLASKQTLGIVIPHALDDIAGVVIGDLQFNAVRPQPSEVHRGHRPSDLRHRCV